MLISYLNWFHAPQDLKNQTYFIVISVSTDTGYHSCFFVKTVHLSQHPDQLCYVSPFIMFTVQNG